MAPRPIIIDCDPGQDDAVALLLALASPELEVLGITTVHGNVPLATTSANARALVEFAGRPELPVFAGSDRPLRRPGIHAVRVHGPSGLQGFDLPPARRQVEPRHAVEVLVDTLRERDDVTLCPLGPLTNIAAAFTWAPEVVKRVRRIVLMGGASKGGNVTPAAEFNIHADPEAAAQVFAAGVPITMFGLDVTHKALVNGEHCRGFRAAGRIGKAAAGWCDFPERYNPVRYGAAGLPLHDPCVIAWLIDPTLFAGRECFVAVETESPLTLGQTVVDWWGRLGEKPNATVIDRIDDEGFFRLLTERLARLG